MMEELLQLDHMVMIIMGTTLVSLEYIVIASKIPIGMKLKLLPEKASMIDLVLAYR